MIKKLTFILLAAGCTQIMYAQSTEKNEKFLENKTLFEELTNVKKKQDKFNLFLNMQGSFDANFRDGFEEGAFKMRQLRIEAKGNINNWLSYRYRQRGKQDCMYTRQDKKCFMRMVAGFWRFISRCSCLRQPFYRYIYICQYERNRLIWPKIQIHCTADSSSSEISRHTWNR